MQQLRSSEGSPRVVHCYRTYFPDPQGGGQEAIRQIALATQRCGIDNKIFSLSPNPSPQVVLRPEGPVTRARSWIAPASCDIGLIHSISLFSEQVKNSDIVHYHYPWPFADVLHQFVRPTCPTILTYHSDIVRQRILGMFYGPLMWRMLRSMQAIVATSPAYARTSPVLSQASIKGRVHVIPLGIDENVYPKEGDASIFDRIGVSASEPYFLFVGVLRYYKGLEFLVRAAKGINAKIVIAGSGPEDANLKRMAKEIETVNIVFAGQITDPEKVSLLRACNALVLPSHLRSEAFGMVLVEAAMFGRPQISCEIGTGTSYVNLHMETGFVVPPEDPEAIAAAMLELLENKPLAEKMGAAARARYERLFSGAALGRAYSELYRKLLKMADQKS